MKTDTDKRNIDVTGNFDSNKIGFGIALTVVSIAIAYFIDPKLCTFYSLDVGLFFLGLSLVANGLFNQNKRQNEEFCVLKDEIKQLSQKIDDLNKNK